MTSEYFTTALSRPLDKNLFLKFLTPKEIIIMIILKLTELILLLKMKSENFIMLHDFQSFLNLLHFISAFLLISLHVCLQCSDCFVYFITSLRPQRLTRKNRLRLVLKCR